MLPRGRATQQTRDTSLLYLIVHDDVFDLPVYNMTDSESSSGSHCILLDLSGIGLYL